MESPDPLKEINAFRAEVALGVRSPQEIATRRGRDYDEVVDEIAEAKPRPKARAGLRRHFHRPGGLDAKNNLTTRNAAFGSRQSPASLDDCRAPSISLLATEGRVPVWDWERGMIDENPAHVRLLSGTGSAARRAPAAVPSKISSVPCAACAWKAKACWPRRTFQHRRRRVPQGHRRASYRHFRGLQRDESYWIPKAKRALSGNPGVRSPGPSAWSANGPSGRFPDAHRADDAAKARSTV